MTVQVTIDAGDGRARAATVHTQRGRFRTPCFMPVGTKATVRAVATDELADLGTELLLANTYHLMLRPGADVIEQLGGLHAFCGWDGPMLTDSGGFQVFSLDRDFRMPPRPGRVELDDDGVTFTSIYDGSTHRLTPESAVRVQEQLGADIQMALDVCPALPAAPEAVHQAVRRTQAWAERARDAHRRPDQALFGIVQGGVDVELRAEAAANLAALDFAGYGIGGLSVGETRGELLPALAAATAELPTDRLRYLMGVGDPAGFVLAVGEGVDLFDCVLPSRVARHATILTSTGTVNLRNAKFASSDEPLDPACDCRVCARYSRAYLRHLFQVREPTSLRLATLHNLAWTLSFVASMRAAIESGTFAAFRAETLAVWARARGAARR
ncbi:MAG: tRNA guanosine(34) transglycosylase Tgt [Acidimicrobiales bacterium]